MDDCHVRRNGSTTQNKMWELVPLPDRRKAIDNKWVYKIKCDNRNQIERYRARLVVKEFSRKEEQLDVRLHFFMVNLKKKYICSNQVGTEKALKNREKKT
ncbi:uncharacterized mitochondrial protein AtMg00820-like [Arachis stenosperma]|uniref:uncharacterized mitochondrial protein AtMg00820-like n=1 Tax=Arachis stenosperma TaxID=217475 RepID=UPI0025AD883F|nr:uncharacterized mitochondrial protein AtMg00820-like [Arachis stenosperma]